MNKTILILLTTLFLLPQTAFSATKGDEKVTIMSFNIRNSGADDGTNSWPFRYYLVPMMIDDQKPDLIGFQEVLRVQFDYLADYARPYKFIGVGRDDGKKKGEHMAIAYNPKTMSVSKWGTFWLSETPNKPGLGWDAACNRTATWALVKDKRTKKSFYFVNTHLDHKGKEAQEKGINLILEKMAEINKKGLPIVIGGDFNLNEKSSSLAKINAEMTNSRTSAAKTDNGITYNSWGKTVHQSQIDQIYYKGFSACEEFKVLTKKYDGRAFISDHFPVMSTLVY